MEKIKVIIYCPINLDIPFVGIIPKSLILDRIINPEKPHFSFETLFEFIPASSKNAKAVLDWVNRLVRISRHENEHSGKEINRKPGDFYSNLTKYS